MTQFDRMASIQIEQTDGNAVLIEHLRISFNVKKTATSSANSSDMSVYNLSPGTRNKIKERDALVTLKAGYAQDTGLGLLFVGNAEFIHHERTTPEVVTIIECQDGIKPLREVRISVSFAPGSSVKSVLEGVASKLGLPVRIISTVGGTYPRGFSFAGPVHQALDLVCRRAGLEWSIQNNEIQIVEHKGSVGNPAFLISPETGMIGSPERINYLLGQLTDTGKPKTAKALAKQAKKAELAWKVKCLLNPKITPGTLISLGSNDINGEFVVDNVSHVGDTHGPDWYSEMELRDKE